MNRILRRRSRGQSLVEFALIFPVLMLLLFGIFDFGRAIYEYNTLANAARQGVRVAIVNQNVHTPGMGCFTGSGGAQPDTSKTTAQDCAQQAAVILAGATATVTYRNVSDSGACTSGGTADGGPAQVGCLAVVTVTYSFVPITPIISSIVPSIALSSTSKQPVEFICPISAAKCLPGQ